MSLALSYRECGKLLAGSVRLGSRIEVPGDGSIDCINAFIDSFHEELFDAVHTEDSSALFVSFDGNDATYVPRDPKRVFLTKATVGDRNTFTPNTIWHRDLKETNMVGFPRLQKGDKRLVIPTLVADSDESVEEAFRMAYEDPAFVHNPIRSFDVSSGWMYARSTLSSRFGLNERNIREPIADETVKILLNSFFRRMLELLSPEHCSAIGDRNGGILVMDTEKLPHAKAPVHAPSLDAAPYVTATMWRKKGFA